jgi:transposase InsO family protein
VRNIVISSLTGMFILYFRDHVLAYLGLPVIFQSDNGSEFVNHVLKELLNRWPGNVTIIHSRPRHPQSQGAVESGHKPVQKLLNVKTKEDSSHGWAYYLSEIMCRFHSIRELVQSRKSTT